jgi:hypothetical protein
MKWGETQVSAIFISSTLQKKDHSPLYAVNDLSARNRKCSSVMELHSLNSTISIHRFHDAADIIPVPGDKIHLQVTYRGHSHVYNLRHSSVLPFNVGFATH